MDKAEKSGNPYSNLSNLKELVDIEPNFTILVVSLRGGPGIAPPALPDGKVSCFAMLLLALCLAELGLAVGRPFQRWPSVSAALNASRMRGPVFLFV